MNSRRELKKQPRVISIIAAFMLTLATSASADPGNLSQTPLFTSGSAEPNIMLMMDSSGSMYEVVLPPEDYDAGTTYASCSNPIPSTYTEVERQCSGWGRHRQCWNEEVTKRYQVNYRVNRGNGSVQFNMGGDDNTWRTWDTSSDCFDDSNDYAIRFYADGINGSYYYTGNHHSYSYLNLYDGQDGDAEERPRQSGHFLNWFFSTQSVAGGYQADTFTESDGTVRRAKLGVDRRTDIMKTAAGELVSGLDNVRVGLMEFNGNDDGRSHNGIDGARLLKGLESVSSSRATMVERIGNIGASGGTPLSESFENVGRYFITGYEDQELEYEDVVGGAAATAKSQGQALFSDEPNWNNLGDKPDATVDGGAIQYYCQKSFMVALTDGEPSSDDDISDKLKDYDYGCNDNAAGCTNSEMDDVIKALYDIDLRPDLKKPNGDAAINNITSYIIGFAEGGLSDTPLMKNAGVLGGGGVYNASNASELRASFNRIVGEVKAAVGSGSSVAVNSTSLDAGVALFAAKFDTTGWKGELSARAIDLDGNIAEQEAWEAGALLDLLDPASRTMLTFKEGIGGVAFTTAGIGSGSKNEQDLNIDTTKDASDGRAALRLAYLRGSHENEGKEVEEFRERVSRLGDIVNSTPVYVGKPNARWPDEDFPVDGASYGSFKETTRTPVVYVGANDGFLHGFNASTSGTNEGKELIAYTPAALLSTERREGLHVLSSQEYLHRYYVDGTPTVSDVYINSTWKSILVGGLGAGGKGYYALDVTNPANFSEANADSLVLWEFSNANSADLGYTFSRPQIGLMPNGKWAAIFGNGYNSTNGDAGIFIVYIEGAEDGTLSSTDWKYISTGVGTAIDQNGMSTPTIVDANLDGVVDRIYAGDIKGNLWAFDVSKKNSSQWKVEHSKPLFRAGEPITAAPLALRNAAYTDGGDPNLLITFGTGQYLIDTDISDTTAGGFYAVTDDATSSGNYGLDKDDLVERTIGTRQVAQGENGSSTRTFRTLTGADVNWGEGDYGWYIQLKAGSGNNGGERVVTRPDLLNRVLFFNTMIPTGEVCSSGGYGWLMSVDVRTGLAPTDFGVFDGNGDGTINDEDKGLVGEFVDSGIPNKPGFVDGGNDDRNVTQIIPDSSGNISTRRINTGGGEREGRLSWEELMPTY